MTSISLTIESVPKSRLNESTADSQTTLDNNLEVLPHNLKELWNLPKRHAIFGARETQCSGQKSENSALKMYEETWKKSRWSSILVNLGEFQILSF